MKSIEVLEREPEIRFNVNYELCDYYIIGKAEDHVPGEVMHKNICDTFLSIIFWLCLLC